MNNNKAVRHQGLKMSQRKNILIVASALFAFILFSNFVIENKPTIFLIGDSTMADKPLDDNPERGWGQVLPLFFNENVTIENYARNGRSTKSFFNQGLWKAVHQKLKPGDYVFIQFGHNDSKISDTARYAEPHTTYKKFLELYVNQSREKGAIPILITPVNRRKFDAGGKFVDQHGDYPGVVREVAKELDVPLIDLHKKSLDLFNKLGSQETLKYFLASVPPHEYKALPDGKDDNTHFTRFGAIEIAKLVAESIKELGVPLENFLLPTVDFSNRENGKVVALDYYFNHELKKDANGNEIQFHYIWEDKENSGFSKLGNIIENLGATLYEIHDAPTYKELKNASIYIIVDPDTPAETAQPNYIDDHSIDEIVNWVKQGGVLLLMANDKGNCEFEHLNNLAEKFGIHFNEDSRNHVDGTKFDMGKFDVFPKHPIFDWIKKIYMKEISTIKLKAPAEPILTDSGDIIMAGSNYGKGYVFAVGDPWLYNEYITHWRLPKEFQNYEAGENLFRWLLDKAKVVKK